MRLFHINNDIYIDIKCYNCYADYVNAEYYRIIAIINLYWKRSNMLNIFKLQS